jgi:hypothetical protein
MGYIISVPYVNFQIFVSRYYCTNQFYVYVMHCYDLHCIFFCSDFKILHWVLFVFAVDVSLNQ